MAESVNCHREVKRDNDIKGPINSSNTDAISDISKNHFSGEMGAEARLPQAEEWVESCRNSLVFLCKGHVNLLCLSPMLVNGWPKLSRSRNYEERCYDMNRLCFICLLAVNNKSPDHNIFIDSITLF